MNRRFSSCDCDLSQFFDEQSRFCVGQVLFWLNDALQRIQNAGFFMQIVVGLLTTRQGERMKRSILFFTIAVLAISFSACGDDALPEGLVIPGT